MFHIPISGLKYLCAKYTFCFILVGEQRLGGHHSEDTRNPTPQKEGELSTTPYPEDLEEGEVEEVGKIVTTTGDVLVVEEQAQHFTSASAQILIQDIMGWNCEIDIIKNKLNVLEQQIKNMIDVLGRI
ncbi:hypothetical protein AB205_0071500 [Aquarana catesbeiana]|uniref:Uncharacterized protein n=1 Tax=Aquarana catesbeiana TaxID=8400 RepID=A0A2G9RJM1_AQUCT|nr:hypothetical protein AB205_0071500 [Aquarana catesbeiana]